MFEQSSKVHDRPRASSADATTSKKSTSSAEFLGGSASGIDSPKAAGSGIDSPKAAGSGADSPKTDSPGRHSSNRSVSQKLRDSLRSSSGHRRSRSDTSVYLTVPDANESSPIHTPREGTSPRRNYFDRVTTTWFGNDITLKNFSCEEICKGSLDKQYTIFEQLDKEANGPTKRQSAIERSWRRQEGVWKKANKLQLSIDTSLSNSVSRERAKELLSTDRSVSPRSGDASMPGADGLRSRDASTSVEPTGNSYWDKVAVVGSISPVWNKLITLARDTLGSLTGKGEVNVRDASIKSLSDELVTLHSEATNTEEQLKEMQRVALTNSATLIDWISTQHASIYQVRRANSDLGKGKDAINKAATTELSIASSTLKERKFPEMMEFTVKSSDFLTPATIDQILLEKSPRRSDTIGTNQTQDSVQEEIDRRLKPENVTAMHSAIESYMTQVENGHKDKEMLAKVAALMSKIADEPIRHLATVEHLKSQVDGLDKRLTQARRAADEREMELAVKDKGKEFVREAFDEVWASNHRAVQGIQHQSTVIEKEVDAAVIAIDEGKPFDFKKLHDAIEKHEGHTKDLMEVVKENLNTRTKYFTEKNVASITAETSELDHETLKANYDLRNVSVQVGAYVLDALFKKGVDFIA